MTTSLLVSVIWGASGAWGGYVVGRMIERARITGQKPKIGDIVRPLFGLVLIALVVYTVLSAQQTNECYRSAFSQVIQALSDRSAATGQSSAAQKEFLISVRDGDADAAESIDRYLAALDTLEDARRAAPLPQPPECGR